MRQDKREGEGKYEWRGTGDSIRGNFVNDVPVSGGIYIGSERKEY